MTGNIRSNDEMVPLYAGLAKEKQFYFVSSKNISYIKQDGSVQLDRISQRKVVYYQLPPDITLDAYLDLFLPKFVKAGGMAINPDNILAIYPTGPDSTGIDMICARAADVSPLSRTVITHASESQTLKVKLDCAYLLQQFNSKCFESSRNIFPTADIGFGQKLYTQTFS